VLSVQTIQYILAYTTLLSFYFLIWQGHFKIQNRGWNFAGTALDAASSSASGATAAATWWCGVVMMHLAHI
jgi:hypothetical protein